jgi:hypothetical protein
LQEEYVSWRTAIEVAAAGAGAGSCASDSLSEHTQQDAGREQCAVS